MPVNTRLQIRRGTHSEWSVANPVLHYGEMAWESDTGRIKIGPTGDLNWQSIPYSFATLQDPSNAGSLNSFLSESGISLTGVTGVYGHVTGIQIDSKLSPGTDIGLSTDGNGSIVISYTGDASLNFQDRAQVETIQDIVGSGDLGDISKLAAIEINVKISDHLIINKNNKFVLTSGKTLKHTNKNAYLIIETKSPQKVYDCLKKQVPLNCIFYPNILHISNFKAEEVCVNYEKFLCRTYKIKTGKKSSKKLRVSGV